MRIIAVVPAYNEEKTIGSVVSKTKNYVDKVVVVDDFSKDNTSKEAKKAGAIVLRHPVNLGLGSSLKTGCEAALRLKGDVIVTLDGDGQHDPKQIPKLAGLLQREDLDIVFGRRPYDKKMPVIKKIGNWGIDTTSRVLYGIDVKDTQSGFRVFTAEAYKKIKWDSQKYAVSSEIVMNAGKKKLKYKNAVVKTIYLDEFKGTTVLNGVKIITQMMIWRLTRWSSEHKY
jgi:glycosyltransferase involved in cell wall biosynthesis